MYKGPPRLYQVCNKLCSALVQPCSLTERKQSFLLGQELCRKHLVNVYFVASFEPYFYFLQYQHFPVNVLFVDCFWTPLFSLEISAYTNNYHVVRLTRWSGSLDYSEICKNKNGSFRDDCKYCIVLAVSFVHIKICYAYPLFYYYLSLNHIWGK